VEDALLAAIPGKIDSFQRGPSPQVKVGLHCSPNCAIRKLIPPKNERTLAGQLLQGGSEGAYLHLSHSMTLSRLPDTITPSPSVG
jgi:hypothetical protein